jgi:DNA-directed RNA polymerase specialized sigma24 family protein
VVVLKHLRGWALQRIAEHIGRTVPAVASLLRRGLEELRHQLVPEE